MRLLYIASLRLKTFDLRLFLPRSTVSVGAWRLPRRSSDSVNQSFYGGNSPIFDSCQPLRENHKPTLVRGNR
jgi:hypothetical protein